MASGRKSRHSTFLCQAWLPAEAAVVKTSAGSHAWHRNVEWRLFLPLAIAGVIGGVLGAYVLTGLDGAVIKPFIIGYLALIGVWILWRAGHDVPHRRLPAWITAPIGVVGGFLDAIGGGGWGPTVSSTMVGAGHDPRKAVGTVNTAEFFVTATISATFITQLGLKAFTVATIGLLIGGVIAAPLGARLAKRVEPKTLMLMVGVVLTLTSVYNLYLALR